MCGAKRKRSKPVKNSTASPDAKSFKNCYYNCRAGLDLFTSRLSRAHKIVRDEIEKRIPGFPIVLHGSSSVPVEQVKIINQFGGKMKDAVGIPEEQLRRAAKSAVCKINIDSDGRLAMTAAVRKYFAENPAEFDPRKFLGPARDSLKELYKHKNIDVLGSAGKA